MSGSNADAGVTLVYDGDCPVCQTFARRYRVQEGSGQINLVDARQAPDRVRELEACGLSLDEGLVVETAGRRYHGAQAMHYLALSGSAAGGFNRLNGWLFRREAVARALYPLLRFGRRLLLRALGRKPIEPPGDTSGRR